YVSVKVLAGAGDGTFHVVSTQNVPVGGRLLQQLPDFRGAPVAVADLNGDGKLDLVFVGSRAQNSSGPGVGDVAVLLNAGGGTFAPATVLPVFEPSNFNNNPAVTLADANGDGKLDVLVGVRSASPVIPNTVVLVGK